MIQQKVRKKRKPINAHAGKLTVQGVVNKQI